MRTIVTAIMLIGPFVLAHASDKKDTIAAAKVSAERLKAQWSLKAVSATSGHDSGKSTEVNVLVRFEKDVDKPVAQEIIWCLSGWKTATPRGYDTHEIVTLVFLDKDNVVLHRHRVRDVKGEVTGKAGDGFRLITDCDDDVIGKVTRIELRHSQEKTKK